MFNWFKKIDDEHYDIIRRLIPIESHINCFERDIKALYFLLENVEINKDFLNKYKYKKICEFPGIIQTSIGLYMRQNGINTINNYLYCGEILEKLEQKEN